MHALLCISLDELDGKLKELNKPQLLIGIS